MRPVLDSGLLREFGHGRAQRLRQLLKRQDCDIVVAALHAADVTTVHVCQKCQLLLRYPLRQTSCLDCPSQGGKRSALAIP